MLNLFIFTNILAFPSFLGSVKKTKRRNLKDFYRISLGIAVSLPFVTIIQTNSIEEKIIIVFFMFIYFMAFKIIREKLSTNHLLCKNCTEFTDDACINYNAVFVSERNHSRIISDYLQKKISYSEKKKF